MTRRVTITADDFGLTRHATDVMIELAREGKINRVSVLANGMAFAYAMEQLRALPELQVAVHANLTEGRALTDPVIISELVHPDGSFRYTAPQLLLKTWFGSGREALGRAIEQELRAQVSRVREKVDRPVAIDGHQHVQMIPAVLRSIAGMHREEEFVEVRRSREMFFFICAPASAYFRHATLKILDVTVRALFRTLPHPAYFVGTVLSGKQTLTGVRRALACIPSSQTGNVEINVHPGEAVRDDFKGHGRWDVAWYTSPWRVRETEMLRDPLLTSVLRKFQEGDRRYGSTYVLGINCNIHQSAAVLIKDGQLVAAAEEERFTRVKYDERFPERAIAYCLSEAGITLADVEYAGFYWQPWKGLVKRGWWIIRYFPQSLQTFKGGKTGRGSVGTLFAHLGVPEQLRRLGFRGRFYFVDHHLAHAASAFFVSPFKSAAVFTTDFCGENCTGLLARGEGNRITPLKRWYLPHSLGLFYGALTQYLGYKLHADEYRVMGLAPYGKPKFTKEFESMMSFKNGRLTVDNSWFSFHLGGERCYSDKWIRAFGPACTGEDEVETGDYKHYASSGQKVLDTIFLEVGRWLRRASGESALCLAGGVALNSVANGKLADAKLFDKLWVQPAAYDPGCALGVCYYIWNQKLNQPRSFVMEHAYWGPSYGDEMLEAAASRYGLTIERKPDIARATAALLAEGKVIGWYQGRMEWGPRALGNRSILADPRRSSMKEVVNEKIKFREPYRPFAPAVLEEDASTYFDVDQASPYMTIVCNVKEEKRSKIPAVTHVDGSARIQTVSRDANPRYWDLINAFKEVTGESVLLNTSFNVKGEPVVCTPEEAVRCFLRTEMDYLVLGDYLCTRGDAAPVAVENVVPVAAGSSANDTATFLARYILVGLGGGVFQIAFLYIWVTLLGFERTYLLGVVVGFVLSLVLSFLLQKYWTFRDHAHARAPMQLLSYATVSLTGLALNTFLLVVAKQAADLLSLDFFAGWYLAAQTLIVGLVAATNFTLNFLITFREARQERSWSSG